MGIFNPSRVAVLTLLALAGQASAQSFNIEIGTSATVPSSSFGAAAGSPGTWNAVTSSTAASITLKNLDGTNSTVTMTHSLTGSFFNNTNANLTGDYQSLLNDVQADSTITYSFTGLTPGQYLIYTYALDAHSTANPAHVVVNNALGVSNQDSGFLTPTSNDFHIGGTHALHNRVVNIGDTVTITVTPNGGAIAELAGIQIVRMGNNGTLPRFYVSSSATGDNGGRSWANAMTDLQDALESTRRIGSGNEIWIRGGTYKPTTGTDQSISFVIPSSAKVYGGFAGTETTLAQRGDPLFSQTILSGAIGSSSNADNTECVVDARNTGGSTILDGFTVTRGYGDGAIGRGGGMLLDGSFANLRKIRFLYNQGGNGGALSADNGTPKLVDCYFYQNDAFGNGGAIYYKNNLSPLKLVNCDFLGNTSSGNGGAIATSLAPLYAVNCLFSGNQTFSFGQGGALFISCNNATPLTNTITNCSFSNNQGVLDGGALYATTRAVVPLANCILWGDTSPNNPASNEVGVQPNTNSSVTYNQCTVQGKAGVDGLNPLFVNAKGADNTAGTTDDNLRLQNGSPCIDVGAVAALPADELDVDQDNNTAEQLPMDSDGKARRSDVLGAANGASAGSPPVDRGCYEVQMPACPADMNKDGTVDLADFFEFFNAWDVTGAAADVDLSGEVDLADFFTFFEYWDTSCL